MKACLWRDGAVRPPVEAGTHRNDSGNSLNVAGIHVLQGGGCQIDANRYVTFPFGCYTTCNKPCLLHDIRLEVFMATTQRTTQSVTMTVERALLSRAREAGINLSATLTAALDTELRQYEAKKWQAENSEALEALNRFHDEHGCFSDEYRTF